MATSRAMATALHPAELCYEVQDMGQAYLDWGEAQALGLNPQGTVVGTTGASADARRGFVYRHGTLSPLGSLGGDLSDVRAVNIWGLAVGGSRNAEGRYRAAAFYNGKVTDLGTLDGTDSWAVDVNLFNLAVGNALSNGTYHAVSFYRAKVFDLGTVGGNTFAQSVNDRGDIVGVGQTADGIWKGFLRPRGGKMQILGTIEAAEGASNARKINNLGTVCGGADSPGGYHAFLYRKATMMDLGPSYAYSECLDVNDAGNAVGFFMDSSWGFHAFLWRNAEEGFVDLNTRIPHWDGTYWLYRGSSINWAGQITAYGVNFLTGATDGYLLSPVDCP